MMPWEVIGKPKILPICPRKMLMATPLRKPTRIGLERKSARKPSRSVLPIRQRSPVKIAKTTDMETRVAGSLAARGVKAAAIMAHVAASGFTIKCRDVPKTA